jgi:1,2-diacylglycerol 3-alpha-glucosyltransferase
MKILILNPILFTATDGILPKVKTIKDTMIYGMCLGFKKLGHDVTLIAMDDYRPTCEETYDFPVIFMKSVGTRILSYALPLSIEMWHWLKRHNSEYDLVISSETFSFHSLFASLICPQKAIIWQELTAHQRKMHEIPSKIWHNLIARTLMRRVRAVVPRSDKAYHFIHPYMLQTVKTIVDHGINIDKFLFSREKRRQIISSSQLIYRKNVDGIIRIFAKFHQLEGYQDIRLLIAGRGEEEPLLRKLVHNYVKVNEILAKEREKSLNILKKMLSE